MTIKRWVNFLKTNDGNIQMKLNEILDKINKWGMVSVTLNEINFLESFKDGEEEIFFKKLYHKEYSGYGGSFKFVLTDIIEDEDIIEVIGNMTLPPTYNEDGLIEFDSVIGKFEIIKSDLMIFPRFEHCGYIPYDFIEGLEYEFDDFIQDILEDIIEI